VPVQVCTLPLPLMKFNVIKHPRYLLFAEDIKVFHDCILLQADIQGIQGWCTAN
jgi:hypothetical protein